MISSHKSPSLWGVVPAAGIGSRMQSKIPKQYLPIAGATVIEATLSKLLAIESLQGVMVALSPGDPFFPALPIANNTLVMQTDGGQERADSVLNALKALKEQGAQDYDWVLVHDAARPCVRSESLSRLVNAMHAVQSGRTENDASALEPLNAGGVMLAAPVADTLKRAENKRAENKRPEDKQSESKQLENKKARGAAYQDAGHQDTVHKGTVPQDTAHQEAAHIVSCTVSRQNMWQAHTPQCFQLGELTRALSKALEEHAPITDEASAIEHVGGYVELVHDTRDNIKITQPEDLALAEWILVQQEQS